MKNYFIIVILAVTAWGCYDTPDWRSNSTYMVTKIEKSERFGGCYVDAKSEAYQFGKSQIEGTTFTFKAPCDCYKIGDVLGMPQVVKDNKDAQEEKRDSTTSTLSIGKDGIKYIFKKK